MSFAVVLPDSLIWETRPHAQGEPARHVAELPVFGALRANVWRYEPGAQGRRHVHAEQDETFFVLAGTLSLYVGEPPERRDVRVNGFIRVDAGTPLQTVNHGDVDLVVLAHGAPPDHGAELLEPAV